MSNRTPSTDDMITSGDIIPAGETNHPPLPTSSPSSGETSHPSTSCDIILVGETNRPPIPLPLPTSTLSFGESTRPPTSGDIIPAVDTNRPPIPVSPFRRNHIETLRPLLEWTKLYSAVLFAG